MGANAGKIDILSDSSDHPSFFHQQIQAMEEQMPLSQAYGSQLLAATVDVQLC